MSESPTSEFEGLYSRFHKDLLNLSYNIVRDKDSAKDIVQEIFVRLWNNREKVEVGSQIKNYLFKATVHSSLTYLRDHKKHYRLEDVAEVSALVNQNATEELSFKEFELKSRQAIDRLPPQCKTIFLLSRQEGLKYSEIAETLGISVKAVENQMGIALKKLREDLKPYLTLEFISILIVLGAMMYLALS